LTPEDRLRLSFASRRQTDSGGPKLIIQVENYKEIAAAANPPTDVVEQVDAFMLAVADRTKWFGTYVSKDHKECWNARLGLPVGYSPDRLAKELARLGLFETPADAGGETLTLSLTLKGWERVAELRKQARKPNATFVAMWFHDDLNDIYEQGFEPALTDCGYSPPFRIDQIGHTNRIDAEIIERIKRSSLVIADVTGERGGVYYEAGLAQGFGIPVIWTCSAWKAVLPKKGSINPQMDAAPECVSVSWKDRIHFDTRQFHTLFWKDADDLRQQLVKRIVLLGVHRRDPFDAT
jgi:nucleoside 2-deoxyribosyltransferase